MDNAKKTLAQKSLNILSLNFIVLGVELILFKNGFSSYSTSEKNVLFPMIMAAGWCIISIPALYFAWKSKKSEDFTGNKNLILVQQLAFWGSLLWSLGGIYFLLLIYFK